MPSEGPARRMAHGTRHHRHNRLARRVARIVRLLAIVIVAAGVADFILSAFRSSQCFTDMPDPQAQGVTTRVAVESEECRVEIARRDSHSRVDALAVLLAVALLVGAGVELSNAHRRTRRLVLGVEVAVLVLLLAYGALLMYGWH